MINIYSLKNVFFDLDHTLWDFEKNSELTFDLIFKKLNLEIDLNNFLSIYNPINQKCWKLYRENKISQKKLRIKRLEETFKIIQFEIKFNKILEISNLYIKHLTTFKHLFEGTHELLQFLKKKYRLHVITNGFEDVQNFKIKNSGLSNYFENIFTAESLGYKKPHPKIFELAMDKAGANPRSSLMIGDSFEADIKGALAIKMQALHFNSHHEPIHDRCPIFYSLTDIYKMFIQFS